MKSGLSVADSNELCLQYCDFLNKKNNNKRLNAETLLDRKSSRQYDTEFKKKNHYVPSLLDSGESEAMEAVSQLAMVGSKQLGDW